MNYYMKEAEGWVVRNEKGHFMTGYHSTYADLISARFDIDVDPESLYDAVMGDDRYIPFTTNEKIVDFPVAT